MATHISDYAVIGDSRSAALVSRDGSIDWLCWPRFDSPSIFGAILDPDVGGCWRIAPSRSEQVKRWYVGHSNVLVTEFASREGVGRVTDLMVVASEAEKRKVMFPEHELLRIVECVQGSVEFDMRFEPRPNYARAEVKFHSAGALGLRVEHRHHLYSLRAEVPLSLHGGDTVGARLRLRPGERKIFSLSYDSSEPAVIAPLGAWSEQALARTNAWWQGWAARCTYDGPYREQVVRSLLILKLLAYAPSGAIVAAPTTSLPERVGGSLNWDYRFCWVRDASLTVSELLDLGYHDEAHAFVSWLLHCTRLTRPRLSILYDVYGELPSGEELLPHLRGHRGSKPVRIRNAASEQLQLDTYGEVIDAVTQYCRRGGTLDGETRKMLRQFGEFACRNWRVPDQGIWEPRIKPQPHTHSRLLCWTAVDRLLELEARGLLPRIPKETFERARAEIRRDIEEHSWSASLQAYTHVQGEDTVDASLLLLGWYGFEPPGEPRLRATFRKIRERLEAAPHLLYRSEDSRAVGEGAFGICSFWAAEHLARGGGTLDEAERWFQSLLACTNDVGVLAEEIDPATGEGLGNVPQAFTHVGLISAALAIEQRRHDAPFSGVHS